MRYAVLLRGINLGPNRQLGMEDLRQALTGAGLQEVRTHLRSGNVVLSAEESSAVLGERITDVIAVEFDMEVRAVVRTSDQMRRIRDACPYREEAEADPAKVHAVFLDPMPPSAAWESIDPSLFEPDRFAIGEGVVYMHLPDGMGRAKLPAALEKAGKGSLATTRNWRTVEALVRMLEQ